MKISQRLVYLFIVILFSTSAAFAQGLTGSLSGSVTQGGNPLPGVTVTATSPSLQGMRTSVTNEAGGYSIGALPPGDYHITFELAGMNSMTKTVHVGIAQNARADVAMKVGAVAESITVTAAAPSIVERPQVQTNFQHDMIEALPVPRTIVGITGLAPGVVTGVNGASISGAQSFDNLYTVDGAVIQENLRGQPHNLFIEDAIQETTVHTGGAISAEFGNFTGGVVTAISKSGGNELTASGRDSLTNPAWVAPSPHPFATVSGVATEVIPAARISQVRNQYEGTLGGRIVRDRLWFFTAGRYFKRDQTINFSNSNGTYPRQSRDRRVEAKLTGALSQRHNVILSLTDAPTNGTNDCQIGCLDMTSVDPDIQNPLRSQTVFYNGILKSNFLVEAQGTSKKYAFVGYGGDDHDRITGTPVRLTAPGYSTSVNEPFFCGSTCRNEWRNNTQFDIKSTYFLGTRSMGSHNIVAGVDRWHEMRLADNYQSPSLYVAILAGFAPTVNPDHSVLVNVRGGANGDTVQNWPILTPSQGSDLNTNSAYVNDSWDFNNRWQFNLGARYDGNDATDSYGNKVANDSKISPRFGATYDVFGTGRVRLNASYSTYVGRLAETVSGIGSPAGNPARFTRRYQGPDIRNVTATEAMRQIWAWFDSQGGFDNTPLVSQSIPGGTSKVEGSLKSPNVNEWSVGGSTQIGSRGFLRADLINRKWNDFYTSFTNLQTGQVTLATGGKADFSLIRNSDLFTRDYHAVEVQGQYRLIRNLTVGGNYTWSKLRGNYTGETSGGGPGTEGPSTGSYPEYEAFAQSDPVGFLSSDQTHKIRAWGSYDLPTPVGNFNVSVLERYDSGQPYSLTGSIDIRENANFYGTGKAGGVHNPGYVTPPTTVTYYFSKRGQFRFQDTTATDIALNYSTKPSWLAGLSLAVEGELINAFNEKAHTFNTSVLTANNDTTLQKFNPVAGDVPIEGVHWKKGPLFGLPTSATTLDSSGSFQTPRTYRVSLVLRY